VTGDESGDAEIVVPKSPVPQQICEFAGLSSHYPFLMLSCQAGKLRIPTFQVFWFDLARNLTQAS